MTLWKQYLYSDLGDPKNAVSVKFRPKKLYQTVSKVLILYMNKISGRQ